MKEIFAGPDNQSIHAYDDLFDPDTWVIEDRNGMKSFVGRLIGMGTSQREQHSHSGTERNGSVSDRNVHQTATRCTACRWSEIYIFERTGKDVRELEKYIVYTLGPSIIPGENTRSNIRAASSGFEVVELATVRRGERGAPFVPAPHARALAMAAHVDEDIANAYVNRAVA